MIDDLSKRLRHLILKTEERLANEKKASLTPNWLVENDKIFSCELEEFKNFASPCYGIEHGSSNFATQDSSGNLRGGHIVLDNVLVCMHLGKHIPLLQEKMTNGSVLDQIVIRRITSIENTHRTIQTTAFYSCRITSCQEVKSLFGFSFSYIRVEVLNYIYDASTGYLKGKEGTDFNAGTLKVKRSA